MVVRDSDSHKTTIGAAALQCAQTDSKLVSFSTCASLDLMMGDLWMYHQITNENFWFGVFAPGEMNKRKGSRNFLDDEKDWLMDSYVYHLQHKHLLCICYILVVYVS